MMRAEKSPAFQFYPKDFLTDDKVLEMSSEVRGMYITLLCIDWLNDGFYSSAILKLGGFDWLDDGGGLRDDSDEIKEQLLNCFEPHPTKEGFVTNPRLQRERQAQLERRSERSAAGKKGAVAKWGDSQRQVDGSAIPEPMAKDGSPSPSPSSSSVVKERERVDPLEIPELDQLDLAGLPDQYLNPNLIEAWKRYRVKKWRKWKSDYERISFEADAMRYGNRINDFIRDLNAAAAGEWKNVGNAENLERKGAEHTKKPGFKGDPRPAVVSTVPSAERTAASLASVRAQASSKPITQILTAELRAKLEKVKGVA